MHAVGTPFGARKVPRLIAAVRAGLGNHDCVGAGHDGFQTLNLALLVFLAAKRAFALKIVFDTDKRRPRHPVSAAQVVQAAGQQG